MTKEKVKYDLDFKRKEESYGVTYKEVIRGIMYKPHRGQLSQSLSEIQWFKDEDEMIASLINKHNKEWGHIFNLTKEDIIFGERQSDDRIGWFNMYPILCKPYEEVQDKEGYLRYFNTEYNYPLMMFGYYNIFYQEAKQGGDNK